MPPSRTTTTLRGPNAASTITSSIFASSTRVFALGFLLRLVLLVYGIYQDAHSALKYTDIDYYVFTDASRAVYQGRSPYTRNTYRYTPLLSWLLLPTAWSGKNGLWFHSGKALFGASDLVAGWLIMKLLRNGSARQGTGSGMDKSRALKFASVWVLNPMVANISTRGSSEGLLCVLVMATLWAFETRRIVLAGSLLGLSVHFKIYPFIYGVSMVWALQSSTIDAKASGRSSPTFLQRAISFLTWDRLTFATVSLTTFLGLNAIMYKAYGSPFLQHTFFHHVTRIDHRHNFSPYNTLLYLSSSEGPHKSSYAFESLAFIPQVLLSTILIPLTLSKTKDHLPATMLAQTLAFVTFNKVCTSQYFLWYLIFLPLYLPYSSLTTNAKFGLGALALWIFGQALWLQQGYKLEFLGRSTFVPGLWAASMIFFAINCWILGIVVGDVIQSQPAEEMILGKKTR